MIVKIYLQKVIIQPILSEAIQCFINYGENFKLDGFDMLKEYRKRSKRD